MENKEYRMNPPKHGPMGRGPARGGEKAKDFVGTWKKLLAYCRKYLAGIIVAVVCAIVGTVLTLLGPDKLGDLTNEIKNGLLTAISLS